MAQPTDDIEIAATNANWSTGPLVGQPVKVEPTAGELANGLVAGQSVKAEHINHILNNNGSWIANIRNDLSGYYGDGSDGNATISGGTTTLARDMYYENLTIESSGVLNAAGFRVFVRDTLEIEGGGVVRNDGGNGGNAAGASPGSSGASAPAGSTAASGSGAAGVVDGVGAAGNNANSGIGGAGGAGGATIVPAFAGGTGGTITAPTAASGGWRDTTRLRLLRVGASTALLPGAGGGSGASGAAGSATGGGGGGGGMLPIYAMHLRLDGGAIIRARGGDAGTPTDSGGIDAGGSGGGGGGAVLIVYRYGDDGGSTPIEPADVVAHCNVDGGTATNGVNGAGNGVAGSPGTIVVLRH